EMGAPTCGCPCCSSSPHRYQRSAIMRDFPIVRQTSDLNANLVSTRVITPNEELLMTTADYWNYPFSAPERLDLEPLFTTLRAEQPLTRVKLPHGEPAWMATRYDDVKVVLGDPRFSRAAAAGRDEPRVRPYPSAPGNILSFDPPDHTRLRRLVMKAFTVRRVEGLRPRAQQIANELIDKMLAA